MSVGVAFHQRLVGVISGMVVWAVWFVTVYALTGVGCDAGWNRVVLPVDINLLTLVLLFTVIAALGLIGWCGRTGYVAWRQARLAGLSRHREAVQRQRFMGLAMALLSAIAAIGTLLGALPMLMLDPCAL